MSPPEGQDAAVSSPTFDSKRLGRLALARQAVSMETELTRSSRWNLPPAVGVSRSVSLDSTKNLNLDSLRKLGDAMDKREAKRRPSVTADGEETATSARTMDKEQCCTRNQERLEDTETSVQFSSLHEEGPSGRETGVTDNSWQTTRGSLRRGVDEKSLAALAELARRRREETPSIIVLPSNRPFLVGERANWHRQQALSSPESPTRSVTTLNGSIGSSPLTTASSNVHDDNRKEAPNITVLSKLLFFGGKTPKKVSSPYQTTKKAALTPDVTMSSESDSSDSVDVQQSYLLQLGHLVGGVTRCDVNDMDESVQSTASTISSLEHPVILRKEAQRQWKFFRLLLFLLVCVAASTITISNGCTMSMVEQTWAKVVTRARGRYNATVLHVGLFLESTSFNDAHSMALDCIDGNVHREELWCAIANLTSWAFHTYHTIVKMSEPTYTTGSIPWAETQGTTPVQLAPIQISTELTTTRFSKHKPIPFGSEEVPTRVGRDSSSQEQHMDDTEWTSKTNTSAMTQLQTLFVTDLVESIGDPKFQKLSPITTDHSNQTKGCIGTKAVSGPINLVAEKDRLDRYVNYTGRVASVQLPFWKSSRLGPPFHSSLRRPHVPQSENPTPCFFSDVFSDQCHPSSTSNVCCDSEFLVHVTVPHPGLEDIAHAEGDKGDGFLQIPLVDVVADFIRERRKRRRRKRSKEVSSSTIH